MIAALISFACLATPPASEASRLPPAVSWLVGNWKSRGSRLSTPDFRWVEIEGGVRGEIDVIGFDGKTVTSMVLVITGNGDTYALELRRDAQAGEPPMTTKHLDCLASGKHDSRCRRSSTRRRRSAPPPDPLGRAFLYSGRFWEKEQTLAFELVRFPRRENRERGIPTFLTLQLSDGKLTVDETFGLGQHSHWELDRVP